YGARDRFGIKPLYYKEDMRKSIVASEMKSMILSRCKKTMALEPLQHYFTYQYVPEPMTLTEGIHKVRPGHYFIKEMGESFQFSPYFHASFAPKDGVYSDLSKRIRNTLIDSVNVHMDNDLQIGAFLSGGIDSSLIVAIANEVNPALKTFSVGFEKDGYSEVHVAQETADKLGVDHISYIISPEEYVAMLPEV